MWWENNKRKVLIPFLVLALLIGAFYYGGNAPGSRGWQVGTEKNQVDDQSQKKDAQDIKNESLPKNEPESIDAGEANQEEAEASDERIDKTNLPTMEINPETGKDKYQTDPVPEGKPLPVEPENAVKKQESSTCTLSISCLTILDNLDFCDPEKVELVPEDGWILEPIEVVFYEGESVFNILQRVCKQNKIHMEFVNTPMYNSAYIQGIHNLYEFDVGELSGWMYKVNDWFPNYGVSRYQLKPKDIIEFVYTCDLGFDVGGGYAL